MKLPEWAQQVCAQDASSSTNEPPFTAALAEEVGKAAEEVEKMQSELVQDPQSTNSAAVLPALRRLAGRCAMIASNPINEVNAGILCQTNAYIDAASVDGCDWQRFKSYEECLEWEKGYLTSSIRESDLTL